MTDAKIKELEGQLLALRERLDHFHRYTVEDSAYAGSPFEAEVVATLTDTAQAGRDAEARVLERAAWRMESNTIFTNTVASRAVMRQINRLRNEANRLRNGGSEACPSCKGSRFQHYSADPTVIGTGPCTLCRGTGRRITLSNGGSDGE